MRQHIVFLSVIVATGAVMVLAGPASLSAVAVVFLGLFLVHLNGLRLATRALDTPAVARKPTEARRPAGTRGRGGAPQVKSGTEVPKAKVTPHRPASSSSDAAGDRPGPNRSSSRTSLRAATGPDEKARWLDEQLQGDVDDITFLPAYASEDQQDRAGDDEGDDGWTPPESIERAGALHAAEAAQAVESSRDVPIPRHFALGTVAIIRDLMKPGEVAQILLEQRRQPRTKFGEVAVEMGFLTPEQLETLLRAQQEGLFTDEEIQEARKRLRSFRQMESTSSP